MKEIDFIIREIDTLPPKVLYVKYKYKINKEPIKASDITLASEKSLAKDWLKPDEDEAWRDL